MRKAKAYGWLYKGKFTAIYPGAPDADQIDCARGLGKERALVVGTFTFRKCALKRRRTR